MVVYSSPFRSVRIRRPTLPQSGSVRVTTVYSDTTGLWKSRATYPDRTEWGRVDDHPSGNRRKDGLAIVGCGSILALIEPSSSEEQDENCGTDQDQHHAVVQIVASCARTSTGSQSGDT